MSKDNSTKSYKFLHPSVYKGALHDKDSVHDLDAETASALGEDTVVEVKAKEVKEKANKQQEPSETK